MRPRLKIRARPQCFPNTASIASGTKLTATLGVCTSGTGPCGGTPPTIISAAPTGPVIVGTPFTHTFTANGSPAPTFALTAGILPPGLTLAPAGVLSGTATSAGTGTFSGLTVTASNGNLPSDTQNFSLSAVTRANNYIASYGLTGGNALPTADPNGDSVTNLLAYALGLDPTLNLCCGLFSIGTILASFARSRVYAAPGPLQKKRTPDSGRPLCGRLGDPNNGKS